MVVSSQLLVCRVGCVAIGCVGLVLYCCLAVVNSVDVGGSLIVLFVVCW